MFPVKRSPSGPGLPALSLEAFSRGLSEACAQVLPARTFSLSADALKRLLAHYLELRRWSPGLSLIGPGTVDEVLERHYAESLAGLLLLGEPSEPGGGDSSSGAEAQSQGRRKRTLVDLGSGAGFPGWVLGAVRPDLSVTLVEARERKWSFLQSATRRAEARGMEPGAPEGLANKPRSSLPIRCLNARVGVPLPRGLPERIDVVTTRALKLKTPWLEALSHRLTPTGLMLLWLGDEVPTLPPGLEAAREVVFPGSDRRRILELTRTDEMGAGGSGEWT